MIFTIRTARLALRPFELGDLRTTHAYASDKANTEYMMHLPNGTIQETEQFLCHVIDEWGKDNPQEYEFAVVIDGKHIGAAAVSLSDDGREGELGWIIRKEYQGKGYGTEAAKAVLDFAFEKLKVKKVTARCDLRNESSQRVMQKIGLVFENDERMRRYKGSGEDVREVMYSLIKK